MDFEELLFEMVNGSAKQNSDGEKDKSTMGNVGVGESKPLANGEFDVNKLIPVKKEERIDLAHHSFGLRGELEEKFNADHQSRESLEKDVIQNKKHIRRSPVHFVKKISRVISIKNIRRVPKKAWAVLVIIILAGYFGYVGYQAIPRQFSLTIKAAKSNPKNNLATYVLTEKPKLLIKKPKINPILAGLVRITSGNPKNSMRVVLTTPRKEDVAYDIKSSVVNGERKISLIPKANAQEMENTLAEKIQLTQEDEGLGMKLPSLDEVRGAPRGRYIASVYWMQDGLYYNSSFAFSWGVLVLNTDKDRYEAGEKVRVGAGMVDDRGYTICDGDVTATITDPTGKKVSIKTAKKESTTEKNSTTPKGSAKTGIKGAEKLSGEQLSTLSFVTGSDSSYIATSPACGPHSITNDPDYYFQFSVPSVGKYTIDLSATTEHGTENVSQSITVGDTPIEIARSAAMRIYPLADYDMNITVKAKEGYSGVISEKVPVEFGISCSTCRDVLEKGEYKILEWNAQLQPDEPETFTYSYNPPDVSPALYFAGPVMVGQRVEDRVWAIAFDAVVPQVTLTQRGYIFEDDDGTNVRNNSDVAAANTAITSVKKGERVSVRFQVDNTSANTFFNPQFELYYDRNDNIWTRTGASGSAAVTPATGNCTDTNWDCWVIDNTANMGEYSSVAVDQQNTPWVSYLNATAGGLYVAKYSGSNGNCGGSGGSWSCSLVDNTVQTSVATDSDISVMASGAARVIYHSGLNITRFAEYVGSGGNCTDTAWKCTSILTSNNSDGVRNSIVVDNANTQWISLSKNSISDTFSTGKFVGSGGTGCTNAQWQCYSISTKASSSEITKNATGSAWFVENRTSGNIIQVGMFVSSGGVGCTSAAWNCSQIDTGVLNTNGTKDIGIATDTNDNPWVSYNPSSTGGLEVATYVGSGGNCPRSVLWNCTLVDTIAGGASYNDIAFDPMGNAWVSYYDATNKKLKVAQYIGSGGTGCTSSAWTCTTVDSTSVDVGQYAHISFGPDGTPWVSYYDLTNTKLKVAHLKRGGEIISGYGMAGLNGDAYVSTAAGACGGGTSFVTGIWTAGVNLASGAAKLGNLPSNKCTEVSFMIDTSKAIVGTTYRLRLHNKSPGYDMGLNTYTQDPTFTVVDSSSDSLRINKDVEWDASTTDCTDTAWGCATINSNATFTPQRINMAMDASGSAWLSTYDNWFGDLWVEKYVGANGGGCGVGVTAWKCTLIDHSVTNKKGEMNDIGIDPSGKAWISYYDRVNNQLEVAEYVGSGGTGCGGVAATDWSCYDVDASGGDTGGYTSIDFDANGNPWISNFGFGNFLRLSRYVGSGGTGCKTLSTWDCYNVDTNTSTGYYTSLKFDQNHVPWIAYYDQSGTNALHIAQYVGTGGGSARGCGANSSAAWSCEVIDDTANTLGATDNTALAIDNNNAPWVAYYDSTGGDLWVAHYVGTGGSGCTNSTNSGKWTCTKVESTNDIGKQASMAIGPDNKPWVSYYDVTSTALRVARYVGGGSGTGCQGGGTGSTDWTCTAVDNTGSVGGWTAIEFDKSGTPWVAEADTTAASATPLRLAKLHLPYYDNQLRYSLDDTGYTAVSNDDSSYDIATATLSAHMPIYRWSKRYSSTTTLPSGKWIGQSTVAASSKNILLQVYRYGSTNAWETVTTNSSCSANTDCTISGTPSGTASEYWQTDANGNGYWINFRLYQASGAVLTMKTGLADVVLPPTQISFTTGAQTVTSGVCSGAVVPFTIVLRSAAGVTTSPTGTTVVQITSDSSSYTIYSDNTCSTPIASGNITFTTADTTKTFYIVDGVRGSHVLTATKTSGPDTITTARQYENTISSNGSASSSSIQGGTTIKGGTTLR